MVATSDMRFRFHQLQLIHRSSDQIFGVERRRAGLSADFKLNGDFLVKVVRFSPAPRRRPSGEAVWRGAGGRLQRVDVAPAPVPQLGSPNHTWPPPWTVQPVTATPLGHPL